jgi:hypothetical protein
MRRPVELALGEAPLDFVSGPPGVSHDGFLFSETWAAVADALVNDPALALAPLKTLRDRRFIAPVGRDGKGWPPTALPTLFKALDAARAVSKTSPTLAAEIWGTAVLLLGAWARWHSDWKTIGDGQNGMDTAAVLKNIIHVVVRDAGNVKRHACDNPSTFHVPGGPSGPVPALCLACVASSPNASHEIRAVAFDAALEVLAENKTYEFSQDNNPKAQPTQRILPAFASAQDARALASAFVYLAHACELMDDFKSLAANARRLAETVWPLWRGDGLVGFRYQTNCSVDGASASAASAAAQRAGLLVSRAVHLCALRFPEVTKTFVSIANEVLTTNDGTDPMAPCAAYAASGVLLACRRPPPDQNELHVDLEVIRQVSSALEAAARRSARLASSESLADAVAKAFCVAANGADVNAAAQNVRHLRVDSSAARLEWSVMCAGALCASRLVAERVFVGAVDEVSSENSNARLRDACASAMVGGAYRSVCVSLAVLSSAFVMNMDPPSASALVASAGASPLARNAGELIELCCVDAARSGTGGTFPTWVLREATRKFAADVSAGYTGFCARAPRSWRDKLDPAMTLPPFAAARAAVTTACEYLTKIGFPKGPDWDATQNDTQNDSDSFRIGALRVAADALSNLEFARGADFDTVSSSFGGAIQRSASHGRYALALTRMAAALSDVSPVGDGFRNALALELVPAVAQNGLTWDAIADARAHVLLRLFPYAAPGLAGSLDLGTGGTLDVGSQHSRTEQATRTESIFTTTLRLAFRYLNHPRAAIARTAHIVFASSFRASPELTVQLHFLPYLEKSLGLFPVNTPTAPFVAGVGVVAEQGGGTENGRTIVASAIEKIVAKCVELERETSVVPNDEKGAAATTLRRLVFSLLPLVDRNLVPDAFRGSENAVLMSTNKNTRMGAYADLVESILSIGDVARKSEATQWALRLRAKI